MTKIASNGSSQCFRAAAAGIAGAEIGVETAEAEAEAGVATAALIGADADWACPLRCDPEDGALAEMAGTGAESSTAATIRRLESVSRFRRCNSARISDAC